MASYRQYLQMPPNSKLHFKNWDYQVYKSKRTNSSFNLRRAVNAKRQHILLSDSINFCRKFAVRTGRKLKASWQHFTTSGEVVRNSFMTKRVTVNSKELLLRESNGHVSVSCNSIGKHLARIRLNVSSLEADLPTLLYKSLGLNALKKHDLALSKLHLKVQPVV